MEIEALYYFDMHCVGSLWRFERGLKYFKLNAAYMSTHSTIPAAMLLPLQRYRHVMLLSMYTLADMPRSCTFICNVLVSHFQHSHICIHLSHTTSIPPSPSLSLSLSLSPRICTLRLDFVPFCFQCNSLFSRTMFAHFSGSPCSVFV